MAAASGIQNVTHQSNLLECIGGHFNNPDASDLTLRVNQTSYHVHKGILAIQSSVLSSMLTGPHWIESKQKLIQLEEDPLCVDTFSDLLKYLYTGKVTLTSDNVCPLHMLAEKYDVTLLKNVCLAFIEDVLDGVHGDVLKSSLKWLHYIEQYLPDLLDKCFEVFRNNLIGMSRRDDIDLAVLSVHHMKTILDPKFADEMSPIDETVLWNAVEEWHIHTYLASDNCLEENTNMLDELLPMIRFNNITTYNLRKLIKSCTCSNELKDYVRKTYPPASKVYEAILYKTELRESTNLDGICTCPTPMKKINKPCSIHKCTCKEVDQPCIHTNPRLYLVFGELYTLSLDVAEPVSEVGPIKVSMSWPTFDIGKYFKTKSTKMSDRTRRASAARNNATWEVCYSTEEEIQGKATTREKFEITPNKRHLGRPFTIAMHTATIPATMPNDGKNEDSSCTEMYMYSKKVKGIVTKNHKHEIDKITVHTPRRFYKESKTKTSAASDDTSDESELEFALFVALFLH